MKTPKYIQDMYPTKWLEDRNKFEILVGGRGMKRKYIMDSLCSGGYTIPPKNEGGNRYER